MASKKEIDPFAQDDDNRPLTDDQIKGLRPGKEIFNELGLTPPKPRGRPVSDNPKRQVTVRLDADVLDKLKEDGRGWQTRANDLLRKALDL